MKNQQFEKLMRRGECFHELRVPPDAYIVVRLDGRSFSRLTERLKLSKPFDEGFKDKMVRTALSVYRGLGAAFAYTQSDEISLVLPSDTDLYGREVEKIVSVSSARAAAEMSLALGVPAEFDSRIWVGPRLDSVIDYMVWRQSDAARCCTSGWAYWMLRQQGMSGSEATSKLRGLDGAAKEQMLATLGIKPDEIPLWQRRGIAIYGEFYTKMGTNPVTGVQAPAMRTRVVVDESLPLRQDCAQYMRKAMWMYLRKGQ